MKKLNFVIILAFFLIYSLSIQANINIKFKIDNEIITNIDILNEKKYLIFLRPSLKNLPDDEILKISENSLIREIIKKKELNRVFKNIENTKFINDIKKSLFKFKNVKNEKEFLNIAKKRWRATIFRTVTLNRLNDFSLRR